MLVEAVVKRYRGKVQLWHVAARMNQDGAFRYSEEQRLRLVVEAVDRVRAIDPRTPMIVSFDQPWAEYIARKDQELTPLHFADTLVRGELGLAGVGLEINYGYWPGGTLPRDPLEVSRQLDRWSQLGVPLVISSRPPATAAADPLAQHPAQVLKRSGRPARTPAWQQRARHSGSCRCCWPSSRCQAIVWNHWQDDRPHEFPHAGLCDARGRPKPILQTIANLRQELLS